MTKMEVAYASSIGVNNFMMHQYAYATGKAEYDEDGERGGEHGCLRQVLSAVAEYAVAKITNRFWPGCWWGKIKTVDIPPDIEVRWTPDGRLIGYAKDNPNYKFLLVHGWAPKFYLIGWTTGKELLAMPLQSLKPERPKFPVWDDCNTLRDPRELIVG